MPETEGRTAAGGPEGQHHRKPVLTQILIYAQDLALVVRRTLSGQSINTIISSGCYVATQELAVLSNKIRSAKEVCSSSGAGTEWSGSGSGNRSGSGSGSGSLFDGNRSGS